MESRAKALGHAIHPMLIVFPLGLLATAVVFDVLYFITDWSNFAIAAGYRIAAGVVGGLAAGLFGLIDWLAVPAGTRARQIGLLHGGGNVVVLVLFAISWVMRYNADTWDTTVGQFIPAVIGFALAAVTGWLGGELVQRLGVGVDDATGLDAPSSLGRHRLESETPVIH
jgi:uncharacterized membrane protein